MTMHEKMASTFDAVSSDIFVDPAQIARQNGFRTPAMADDRAATPKGWTGPKEVDGVKIEGSLRSHQVPLADFGKESGTSWDRSKTGCGATVRRSCSTRRKADSGTAALAPKGNRRMGANPHANGGLLLRTSLPNFRDYAVTVDAAVERVGGSHANAREDAARRDEAECGHEEFPHLGPGRDFLESP